MNQPMNEGPEMRYEEDDLFEDLFDLDAKDEGDDVEEDEHDLAEEIWEISRALLESHQEVFEAIPEPGSQGWRVEVGRQVESILRRLDDSISPTLVRDVSTLVLDEINPVPVQLMVEARLQGAEAREAVRDHLSGLPVSGEEWTCVIEGSPWRVLGYDAEDRVWFLVDEEDERVTTFVPEAEMTEKLSSGAWERG